ncbi:MAG: hypothetical protein ACR2GC_10100 [Methyloceanibacter sp.]|uniref:hypothetical protein n=1 Tax=Methyloceanibacter sp. TaxID=1965321 RepID=UPI003D9B3EBA
MSTEVLDPRVADRLAKLCGLFSSDHDAERASAAAKADQLIRSYGLTWGQLIAPSWSPTSTIEGQIGFALANLPALSMWERGFVYSVCGKHELSEKQQAVLDRIERKCRAYQEGGGR